MKKVKITITVVLAFLLPIVFFAQEKINTQEEIEKTLVATQLNFFGESMVLTNESKYLLIKTADAFKDPSYHYRILGYSRKGRDDKRNYILSKNRAAQVKNILVLQGVDASSLIVVPKGAAYSPKMKVQKRRRKPVCFIEFEVVRVSKQQKIIVKTSLDNNKVNNNNPKIASVSTHSLANQLLLTREASIKSHATKSKTKELKNEKADKKVAIIDSNPLANQLLLTREASIKSHVTKSKTKELKNEKADKKVAIIDSNPLANQLLLTREASIKSHATKSKTKELKDEKADKKVATIDSNPLANQLLLIREASIKSHVTKSKTKELKNEKADKKVATIDSNPLANQLLLTREASNKRRAKKKKIKKLKSEKKKKKVEKNIINKKDQRRESRQSRRKAFFENRMKKSQTKKKKDKRLDKIANKYTDNNSSKRRTFFKKQIKKKKKLNDNQLSKTIETTNKIILKSKKTEKNKELLEKESSISRLNIYFSMTKIMFEENSSELTETAKTRLNKTAKFIVYNTDIQYIITGHSDNKNERQNTLLSIERAIQVKNYLINVGKVNQSILHIVAKGHTEPFDKDNVLNRRVVFSISNKLD